MKRQRLKLLGRLLAVRWSDTPKTQHPPLSCQRQQQQQQWQHHFPLRLRFRSQLAAARQGAPAVLGRSSTQKVRCIAFAYRDCGVLKVPAAYMGSCWESPNGIFLQRDAEEGTPPPGGPRVCTNLRRAAGAPRRFSSLAEAPDPDHVMLSKERLGTLYSRGAS